jgi:Excreted virulence factor EspC, type VII ESX diderm
MADRIHVVPANLREAAGHHQETSDYLRTLPSSHDAIQESLDSLGPIFGELREAGRELLEQRRQCYEQQADSHAKVAENLTKSASMFEEQESASVRRLRRIADDTR